MFSSLSSSLKFVSKIFVEVKFCQTGVKGVASVCSGRLLVHSNGRIRVI